MPTGRSSSSDSSSSCSGRELVAQGAMVWLALHAWMWMVVAGRPLLLLGALGPLGIWLTLLHMHHATTISKLPTDFACRR